MRLKETWSREEMLGRGGLIGGKGGGEGILLQIVRRLGGDWGDFTTKG